MQHGCSRSSVGTLSGIKTSQVLTQTSRREKWVGPKKVTAHQVDKTSVDVGKTSVDALSFDISPWFKNSLMNDSLRAKVEQC